jgi:hypothetical protein
MKALEASPAWSDAMDQAGTQAYTEEKSPNQARRLITNWQLKKEPANWY